MNLHNPLPRFLTSALQRIWFVWTAIVFTVTGIIAFVGFVFIFNFCSKQRGYLYAYYLTKLWGKTLLALMLVRVKIVGARKVSEYKKRVGNSSFVLISNHQSAMDIPFGMASSPEPFSFLSKIEADKLPIVGYLCRHAHVYVDRKSEQSRQESYQRMKKHVTDGKSIHVFVEGTRNRSDEPLLKFHDGAFRLAIETQKPLAVLTIDGANRIFSPRESFKASPGFVICTWEEPIDTTGMTLEDLPRLKAMARERMLRRLGEVEAADLVA